MRSQDQEWIILAAEAKRQYEEYLRTQEFKAREPVDDRQWDMERNWNVPTTIEFPDG